MFELVIIIILAFSFLVLTVNNYFITFRLFPRHIEFNYKLKRSFLRKCSFQLIPLAIELIAVPGALAGVWSTFELIVMAIFFIINIPPLVIQLINGEGMSNWGIVASGGIIDWESISSYEWRQHFTQNKSYLVLKINKAGIGERYIVVNNIYKDEIENELGKNLPKQLEQAKIA